MAARFRRWGRPGRHWAAAALVIGAAKAPLTAAATPEATATYLYRGFKMWEITSDGRATALPGDFNGGETIAHEGTTAPVVSPDRRWIAHTRDNDLWVWNLKTGEDRRLTHHGRPSTDATTSVYVLITAWSPDSRRVLYRVAHSDSDDPDGLTPDRSIPAAPYGFRITDLGGRISTPLRLPGAFEAWLPDGSFLLTSEESDLVLQRLLRYRPGDELPTLAAADRGLWGQTTLSQDGRAALVCLSQATAAGPGASREDLEAGSALVTRIVKIDLKGGGESDVSPAGAWSEYQLPLFSPSGRRVAYVRQEAQDAEGFVRGTLVVDGRDVAAFDDPPFEYDWVGDHRLVIAGERGFRVVDADGAGTVARGEMGAEESADRRAKGH